MCQKRKGQVHKIKMGGPLSEEKSKLKETVLGIVAHVDAGKTTLSENFLYFGGSIRKLGRVDKRDTFFDTENLERERGITIFSKQGSFVTGNTKVTLLDTPGHTDFSAEMERTLQVLDYAVLIISAPDKVTAYTVTLWKLLERYGIPVFIFVNKTDRQGIVKEDILKDIKEKLSRNAVDFTTADDEEIASVKESFISKYFEGEKITDEEIGDAIAKRELFPVYFGSALRNEGVRELMDGIDVFSVAKDYKEEFSATVYKISRDSDGNRLTHMKITGGSLKVRTSIPDYGKVNQIRVYNGTSFETKDEVKAGCICAVTGLNDTRAGLVMGNGEELLPVLTPVLRYKVIFPPAVSIQTMLFKLKELTEEIPELNVSYDEEVKEINIELMGQVQIEVIKHLIEERTGINVSFGTGKILYKETICNSVEGVGHFEPLRHYAEVHLLLEPLERGMGLVFETDCSEEILAKNWQRLVLTHLEEKIHRGVLTGAPVTDMKITLVSGKAHIKHTEGGDFRQATYRAVRNGLMYADSMLLEPFYDFVMDIPENAVGHAMMDMEKMSGVINPPLIENGRAVLTGYAPVALIGSYQTELTSYTGGKGRITLRFHGYEKCHNQDEVVEKSGYMPEKDLRNTPDSVFCANGAGYIVPWNEVRNKMHMPSVLKGSKDEVYVQPEITLRDSLDLSLGTEEIDDIIRNASHANEKSNGNQWNRKKQNISPVVRTYKSSEKREKYLLVDGYNVIFAWKELSELAKVNLDGARLKLLDILCNYQGITGVNLIAVFDAYKIAGHDTEYSDYHNIHVVYTKEAETADRYIERFAHNNGTRYDIRVVTSDGLEQVIIRGAGCTLVSSREFEKEVELFSKQCMENYINSLNK